MASDPKAGFAAAVLGDEYDQALRAGLMDVLRGLGAVASQPASWVVAGSQEIEEFDVEVYGRPVHVEAETYFGLSIHGPVEIVGRIRRELAARSLGRPA